MIYIFSWRVALVVHHTIGVVSLDGEWMTGTFSIPWALERRPLDSADNPLSFLATWSNGKRMPYIYAQRWGLRGGTGCMIP